MNNSQGSFSHSSKPVWRHCSGPPIFLLFLAAALAAPVPVSAQSTTIQRNTTTIAPVNKAPGATSRSQIGGSVRAPLGSMTVALSAEECTTLGGKSVAESVCNSGKACETTTENGDYKRVCLSKAD